MTYDEFVSQRLRDLLRFAVVLCGDRALGEDLTQEVLLRAHTQWQRVGATDSPFAYVRTMLVHEHLSWRRRWARQVPTADVRPLRPEPDHAEQVVDRDDLVHRVSTLPPKQRAAVVLRYYGGLSDTEIADTLGCSSGTVRGYLSRALATMRVAMTSELHTLGKDS